MKFITAALGDNVEDTTRSTAVFRTESTGLDLNFLNEFERQVSTGTAKSGVGRVNAVEDVVVLRTRRTGDRRIAVTSRSVTQA